MKPKKKKSIGGVVTLDKLGSSFLGTDIDRYVLAYFSTSVQVAVYAIATRILSKLLNIYPNRMFLHLIQPVVYSRYDENRDASQLNQAFKFLYSANNIIGFLLVAVFAPLGEELLLLVFNQEYVLQAYWPLLIFFGLLNAGECPPYHYCQGHSETQNTDHLQK